MTSTDSDLLLSDTFGTSPQSAIRQKLCYLVWSEPMLQLTERFKVP